MFGKKSAQRILTVVLLSFDATRFHSQSLQSALDKQSSQNAAATIPANPQVTPLTQTTSPGNIGKGDSEILSDTQGVDFKPYIRSLLQQVYKKWLPLIPAEAKPPASEKGEAFIRFTILPDGTIDTMHLDSSTHNDKINRSCWEAITSVRQFAALPVEFKGPNLILRVHFIVN